MNATVRTRKHITYASTCACGCGVLILPGCGLEGRYGSELTTFVDLDCLWRFVMARRPS